MIFPPNFGMNLFDATKESKNKVALVETKDDILQEVVVDVLLDARILTYTRIDSIMEHKKFKESRYRIYVSDTMCRKAKMALARSGLECEQLKMLI